MGSKGSVKYLIVILTATFLMAAIAAVPALAGVNAVENGGFETAVYSGWTVDTGQGTFLNDTVFKDSGLQSLRVVNTTTPAKNSFMTQMITGLTTSVDYTVSVNFCSQGATTQWCLLQCVGVSTVNSTNVNGVASSPVFTNRTLTLKPKSDGTINIRIQLGKVSDATDAYWWIDSVTITPLGSITAGNNGPVCSGGTLNLTASTVSEATYAWTGPNSFTSTLQNPTIANVTTAAGGTYSVTATVGGIDTNTATTSATVRVIPTGVPTGLSANTAICNGQSTTLSGTAGTGGDTIVWHSDSCEGTVVGTGLSVSVSPTTTTTYYAQTKITSTGCLMATCATGPTITVNTVPAVATGETATADSATQITWGWTSAGTGVTYKGYDDPSAGTLKFTSAVDGSSASESTGLSANTQYQRWVSSTGSAGCVNSSRLALPATYTQANTPGAPVVNNPQATTLDVNPAAMTPAGTELAIKVSVGGSDLGWVQAGGTVSATAVWQTDETWGVGNVANPITVTDLTTNTLYTFKVRARNADNVETADGTAATGTTSTSCTPVSIITSPSNQVVCTPATAEFTVVPSGSEPLVYQWQVSANGGSTYTTASGDTSTTATYNTGATTTTMSGYKYRCYITNCPGNTSTTFSAPATLTANVTPSAPTSAGVSRTSVCVDDTGTISLSATGGYGGTLKWYAESCEAGTYLGSGTPLVIASPTVTTTYYARYETASCGNSTCASVEVIVNPLPVAPVSASASPSSMCTGGSSKLTATGGSGTTLRWMTGSCGGPSAGTGNNLILSPTTTTTYYARWESSCGNTTCATTTITVGAPAAAAYCTVNPGIDDNTCNWTAFNSSGSTTVSYNTDQERSGTGCVRLEQSASGTKGGVYQRIRVTSGQKYMVTAWSNATGANNKTVLKVDPAGGTSYNVGGSSSTSNTNTTGEYQLMTTSVTAGTSSSYITIFLAQELAPDNTRYAYFDDVTVYPDAPASASANPATVSSGGSSTFSVTGVSGTRVAWYSDAACTNWVGTGNTFVKTNIIGATTLYARNEIECVPGSGIISTYSTTPSTTSATVSVPLHYVKYHLGGTHNGGSWSTALNTIQEAADVSVSGNEIWVASGTYTENVVLPGGVALYGGFAGTETIRTDRNWTTNVTTIDGNFMGSVISVPNDATSTTRIDGFTLTNGRAVMGGGVFCNQNASPVIVNNFIVGNSADNDGGGIYCNFGSAPMIAANRIFNNAAVTAGGGVRSMTGAATLTSNFIVSNTAKAGGGIYCGDTTTSSHEYLVNNTICDNSALSGGGVYCAALSSASVSNNIIAFNSSGICKQSGSGAPTLKKNDLYANDGYNYSGLSAGSTDTSSNPSLASVAYGQVHIQSSSACKNAGDNAEVVSGYNDVDNQTRLQGTVDIGADESDGTTYSYTPTTVFVKTNGSDSSNGSTWALAKQTVQAGINAAAVNGGEVWVKAGTYNERVVLRDYVYVYGGFAGTESIRSQRDWTANLSIIDAGSTGTAGSVVIAARLGYRTSAIDGFTLRNGNSMIGGGLVCDHASPLVMNNTITGNAALRSGGGVYLANSAALVKLNTIQNNSSLESGGGVYCEQSSAEIARNNIEDNTAVINGCGVYVSNHSTCKLINNKIIKNHQSPTFTGAWGIGVSLDSYNSASLVCNTIVDNSPGTNGGVYASDYGFLDMSSNIVAYNGAGIWADTNATSSLAYNCVYGNTGYDYIYSYDDTPPLLHTLDINSDPVFVNRVGGDYRIQSGSGCVNAADSGSEPSDDYLGYNRNDQDIGCYEYYGPGEIPVAPTSASATPSTICSGASVTLHATSGSGTTLRWLTGSCSGTSIGTGNDLVVYPTSGTTYYARWETNAGNSTCVTATVTTMVDNTAPDASFTATENSVNVKTGAVGTTIPVTIQGNVVITVTASDSPAGLLDTNPVTVTVAGVTTGAVTESGGLYSCTATINALTVNGAHAITVMATDKCGNVKTLTDWIYVNKNQITGMVSMGLTNTTITRVVTFVINGGATMTTSINSGGTYTLTNVIDGVTAVSAKTAWTLRKKLTGLSATNGQTVADFELRGGDINNTNSVNVNDYSVLKANWFTSDSVADINGSGTVDDVDYNIMKLNWFAVGDLQ